MSELLTPRNAQFIAQAQSTFEVEIAGLALLRSRFASGEGAAQFARACEAVLACSGRVVLMGIGKSGHIARKIAATLASTGTPAFFVHPAEASHGDLGMLTEQDLLIALSYSGEAEELAAVLPHIKRMGVKLVALCGNAQSTLGKLADIFLDCAIEREACPLKLAPTASTTAQLALGDALALAVMDARGFGAEDFARSHPGGSLGRKLLTHVHHVMRAGDALPRVAPEASFRELLLEMNAKGLGMAAIVDAAGKPVGIFTDGDLRRLWASETETRSLSAGQVMHASPRTVNESDLAVKAAGIMEEMKITVLLVVDDAGTLVGALNSNDLMRKKVI
jgi:arabinose-5-phosphate isomerase